MRHGKGCVSRRKRSGRKAARGYTNRVWPWGNAVEPYANTDADDDGYQNRLAPVGSFPKGKSYYGVMDMAGNVWEWTADWYSDVYYGYSSRAAKRPKKNPTGPEVGSWRVIRGGSWIDKIARCSTTFRFYFYPNLKTSFVGFRLAKTAEKNSEIIYTMLPKSSLQFHLLFSLILIGSAAAQSPIFVDVTEEAGIRFKHSNGKTDHKHIIETMGSGVVFFDYDSDGDADLYFVNSGNIPQAVSKREDRHNTEISSTEMMGMDGSWM